MTQATILILALTAWTGTAFALTGAFVAFCIKRDTDQLAMENERLRRRLAMAQHPAGKGRSW